jgi:L-alanine-DL-glutamate epimerase-like enolase superfamily enzyme
MPLKLDYYFQQWPYRKLFRISRDAHKQSDLFLVHVSDGTHTGRGECSILLQYGESRESLIDTFETMAKRISDCGTPEELNAAMGAGAARNAIDCALWDLRCKQQNRSIWELTRVASRAGLRVDQTIGIDTPEIMQADARRLAREGYGEIKVKANADRVLECVGAIAEAAPGADIIVDANEAWSIDSLKALTPELVRLNVRLIEQPLHRRDDAALENYQSPIPLCADESCATSADFERLARRYDAVNIKLDKAGGLTEGLKMARDARAMGLNLMIGCAGQTSLGLASAFVVGTLCTYRDLDSAALLAEDRIHAMTYRQGELLCFDRALWG